ncbi:MAG TPA: dihydrofolate reductase family protein [Puia sp.]|jgi:dihydrofolate reductase|nr:dihydrofolate reductase family protein [Puia sp.]
MANTIYIATSIDGYIARKDGTIDWLMDLPNPGNSDYGFSVFLDRIDGIIMGRKSFETVLAFAKWPYLRPVPVFVLSNTLLESPIGLPVQVEIVRGALNQILTALKNKGINNLYVDGGLTIQNFLKEDLIDEMVITRVPILLGSGVPLFGMNHLELVFEHVKTEVYNNLLVRSRYLRKR